MIILDVTHGSLDTIIKALEFYVAKNKFSDKKSNDILMLIEELRERDQKQAA